MQPQTVIIMGPSGAGKGTQSSLLQDFFEQQEPDRGVLYVQVGKRFRTLAERDNFTGMLIRGYINDGLLVPEFLTVWAWGEELIEKCKTDQHLIFDGSPRRIEEAKVLDEALRFYERKKPLVIVLNVSKEWSRKVLPERKREDDIHEEDVERRLAWYESDVLPVIDYFKKSSSYNVVEIEGERSMEEVHQSVVDEILGHSE